MAEAAKTVEKAPFLPGSVLWQKKGPLPVWAWLLIGLSALFIIMWWRRNRASANATEAATGFRDELPGDQTAPPVFILPQIPAPNVPVTINPPPITLPATPPAGGAPPPAQLPAFEEAPAATNLYTWFASKGTEFKFVDALNPGWRDKDKNLQWYTNPDGSSNKIPKLNKPMVLKLR